MLDNFKNDMKIGAEAEQIVLQHLRANFNNCEFVDVSKEREYRYKGDIMAVSADGKEICIEVKNDSRIHETGNILCEYENYIKDIDYYFDGNMCGAGDYYMIVSQQERKIYVLDYKRLREIYKRGEYREINHPQQITYCYLLDLNTAKKHGALLTVWDY